MIHPVCSLLQRGAHFTPKENFYPAPPPDCSARHLAHANAPLLTKKLFKVVYIDTIACY